ncbi:CDP-glycerol glycerophosphotransferase family protein [soil metagenome]
MRELTGDESIFLDGAILSLSIGGTEGFATAEVSEVGGNASILAPVMRLAGPQTCRIDLSRLPAQGMFKFHLHTPTGEAVQFGTRSAQNLGRLAKAAGGNPNKKLRRERARSVFSRAGGERCHAVVYADLAESTLKLRLSAADDIDTFLAEGPAAGGKAGRHLRRKYSVVAAVANAEATLDGFLESLRAQSLDFRSCIEVIVVDDGSTDRSAKIIKRWQGKYSANIRSIRQPAAGLAAALNRGLAAASHPWVTFIEPADFVAPDYFTRIDAALDRHDATVAVVSCRSIDYVDATKSETDGDPLRYRLARGERAVAVDDAGMDFQATVRDAVWRKDIIDGHGLAFDNRVRPSGEDALFAARYLLRAAGLKLLFVPDARYFRRRRALKPSVLQDTWLRPEAFDDQVRFGALALLEEAGAAGNPIPRHVQNAALYALSGTLRMAVDDPSGVPPLDARQRQTYLDLLGAAFGFLDAETIAAFGLLPLLHRTGILGRFKDAGPPGRTVTVTELDRGRCLARAVRWSSHRDASAAFQIDGTPVVPAFAKTRRVELVGSPFVDEHIAWLPTGGGKTLRAFLGGQEARIEVGGRRYETGLPLADLPVALRSPSPDETALPPHVRAVRRAAVSPQAQAVFRDAWLFMDRDTEADDSAEYLYRHVREHAPQVNAFFILQRGSPHWARLAADGFRLIGFHEPDHAVALLNAAHLISSQGDHYVVGYLGRTEFGDMLRYRYTFLNHGVIKDDISRWLNQLGIDCFVTSTPGEWQDIVGDGSPDKDSAREVILSGMPRHDALLRASRREGRTIVVMPTWRAWLSGVATGPGNARSAHPAFFTSEFALRWKEVLAGPRLAGLAARHGYRIVFVPHPNIEQYRDFFELPPAVEYRPFGGEPMQDLFGEMSMMITDFSSKAFDAALLEKPVVYYQFDADQFFGGGHASLRSYFDYERDGFGPVCHGLDEVLAAAETVMSGGALDPVYRQRAVATFPLRDGRASERVFNAILNLDVPVAGQPVGVREKAGAA